MLKLTLRFVLDPGISLTGFGQWVRSPSLILALRTHAFGESNEPILNHLRLLKCDLPHTTDGDQRQDSWVMECSASQRKGEWQRSRSLTTY